MILVAFENHNKIKKNRALLIDFVNLPYYDQIPEFRFFDTVYDISFDFLQLLSYSGQCKYRQIVNV